MGPDQTVSLSTPLLLPLVCSSLSRSFPTTPYRIGILVSPPSGAKPLVCTRNFPLGSELVGRLHGPLRFDLPCLLCAISFSPHPAAHITFSSCVILKPIS
ncbi:hypothetical protein HDK64DRAFT_77610 [Phyllosticta capitalensis]